MTRASQAAKSKRARLSPDAQIKAACNEHLRNEPNVDRHMRFSSPFAW